MFIQVIQGRCNDADSARRLTEQWRDEMGPTAEGWLGGTYGLTDDGEFVAVVRFESREAAANNSSRPEQGEWWSRMEECFDGEVTFHDCDDAITFLDGGSDDAGFVQVIQAKLTDPERFREFMSKPMDPLREARPEIFGGTVAIDSDGIVTQTVAFRSEAEAREGEAGEVPEEVRSEMEEEMSLLQDITYLDLHDPWFASKHSTGAAMA